MREVYIVSNGHYPHRPLLAFNNKDDAEAFAEKLGVCSDEVEAVGLVPDYQTDYGIPRSIIAVEVPATEGE